MLKKLRRSRAAVVGVCCALVGAAAVPVISLAGSITGSTGDGPLVLQSGETTPTYLAANNVASFPATTLKANWIRVGDSVQVSGAFKVRASVTTDSIDIYVPLPVASNINGQANCAGTASANYDTILTFSAGQVFGSPNAGHLDQCIVEFTPVTAAHDAYVHYSLTYRVKD